MKLKKIEKKLTLKKETISHLSQDELAKIGGAGTIPFISLCSGCNT